jgi:hypothetical protein
MAGGRASTLRTALAACLAADRSCPGSVSRALKPGHPYLRLPVQFSLPLESRLLEKVSEDELATLRRNAESELAEPTLSQLAPEGGFPWRATGAFWRWRAGTGGSDKRQATSTVAERRG